MADPNIQNILTDPVMRQVLHRTHIIHFPCVELIGTGAVVQTHLQAVAHEDHRPLQFWPAPDSHGVSHQMCRSLRLALVPTKVLSVHHMTASSRGSLSHCVSAAPGAARLPGEPAGSAAAHEEPHDHGEAAEADQRGHCPPGLEPSEWGPVNHCCSVDEDL